MWAPGPYMMKSREPKPSLTASGVHSVHFLSLLLFVYYCRSVRDFVSAFVGDRGGMR